MNKKIKRYLFVVLLLVISFKTNTIKAANTTISITTSRSTIVVGENVTATVSLSADAPLGAWEFSLNYDASMLRLVSSSANPHVVDYSNNTSKKSASYSYTFKTLKSGSTNLTIKGAAVVGWDEKKMNVSVKNRGISIITRAQLEQSYSSNNYLKSLSIKGFALEPAFKKDILNYDLQLENGIEKINITADKEDSKAKITGTGEISIGEGPNKIEVKVTAENGNVRTYVLNVLVKEEDPIIVEINDESYYVVQKDKDLNPPLGYIPGEALINNKTVPIFKNEVTKITLVALKDSTGEIDFYIYDANKSEYRIYKELTFNKLILYINDDETVDMPKDYQKTSIKINEIDVNAYKLDSTSKYSLIYGMNVETGKKNIYMYDLEENTIQRYNNEHIEILDKVIENYLIIIICLVVVTSLSLILIIFLIVRNRKINKKIDFFEDSINNISNIKI